MRHRHLTRRRLIRLLEAGEVSGVIDHVAACEQCAALLESDGDLSSPIQRALSNAVAPPRDLVDRMLVSVADRVRRQESIAVFADLFSIGWQTSKLFVDPTTHPIPEGDA